MILFGRVYKLWSPQTDSIYIGSTKQRLSQRLAEHRRNYREFLNIKNLTSFELLKYSDCKIELLELINYDDRSQLLALEGKYVRELDCVNKCIPGRTSKEYRQDNKEKVKEWNKEYRAKKKLMNME